MSGTIIENLSGKKLSVLVAILLICQVICFLIGGLVAPVPASAQSILGTVCKDTGEKNDTKRWFYNRGKGACMGLELSHLVSHQPKMANQLVFAFQMPVPKENTVLDYSRWQQNLIGMLHFDIKYHSQTEMQPRTKIAIDARLAYRNKGDKDGDWKHYASSLEKRNLDCTIESKSEALLYNCSAIPLFELGSLHHDFYLLNIRLPVSPDSESNVHIGHLNDVWLVAINQNGGFTKVWLSLKTIFFPFIIAIMIWFWHRVHLLSREPVLLEKMLMFLGGTLCLLNLPLEYLTLQFDLPFMLLLGDIRQGLFYAMLLSFWLVFAGEHMLIHEVSNVNSIKPYWKHLSAVATGCISLFVFDMCERGVQLRNPFYSIWVTDIGTNLALTFIILAGISAGVYFLFLCGMIWKVFCNISQKRASLPAMCSIRRLHYEGIIYRFKFMMLTTLICAALTVIGFILGQVAEGQWKWDEDIELEFTSAFFTGVYGMWNIYIFALMILYAPSHKKWPMTNNPDSQNLSEEIEFSRLPSETSPSEISSLTSFIRKSTVD